MLDIERSIKKMLDNPDVVTIAGGPPFNYTLTLKIYHLGPVGLLFPVEIKIDKVKLGWLYSKEYTYIGWRYNNADHYLGLSELKEYAEKSLAEKKFEEASVLNCLQKTEAGGIVGYVDTSELMMMALIKNS